MARTSLTTVLATLLIAAVAFSCSPTNQALKRSKKLAAAGLTYEATMMSLEALERKPGNQKAMIQVKTYGEKEIKSQLREFEKLAEAGETVGALDAFVRARDLEDRANAAGVLLSGTSAHISEYNGLKRNYVRDLVQQGQQSLEQEDFTGAERTFARAIKYSPEDNVIQEMWRSAVAEPMHREAHRMYANQKYRAAYYTWADMESQTGEPYKDSRQYQDSAVFHGMVTVGVRDILAPTRQELNLSQSMRADLINNLVRTDDPFIDWIDWNDQTRYQSNEQPDFLLEMEMTDWTEVPGTMSRYERQGYRKEIIEKTDPDTGEKTKETVYHKVVYYDVDYRVFIHGALKFSLVDPIKRTILTSREVEEQSERIIASAEYSGDPANLYPGQWTSMSQANSSDQVKFGQKGSLDSRFRTRYNPRALEDMRETVKNSLVKKASVTLIETLNSPLFLQ
jgi:tetratricopeptide (TPR) repeat protein